MPRGAQTVAHRLAIRAGGPATEVLHVKSWHILSLLIRQEKSAIPTHSI
jgi:hypothetical protein